MRAGMLVCGRYRLERRLGSGGQASVWLCRDLLVGREVAVKVVDFEGDPGRARRAEREIRALQKFTDPHTVRVLDTGRDDDDHYVYIVMPVVTGESLADRLRRGRMGAADVVSVVRGVSSSLGEAHAQGVCHRDVKPGNIMIHTSGAAVLLDFGIASSLDQTSSLTATGTVIGTLAYMAPEVVCGERATPASDVYSLGAVMYECACGRPPFMADTVPALLVAITRGDYPPPSCAAELRDLIVQMLDPDPGRRPTAQDLLVRLAAIRTSITSEAAERVQAEATNTSISGVRGEARDEQPTSATWRLTTPKTRPYTDGAPRSSQPTATELSNACFSHAEHSKNEKTKSGEQLISSETFVFWYFFGAFLVAFPLSFLFRVIAGQGGDVRVTFEWVEFTASIFTIPVGFISIALLAILLNVFEKLFGELRCNVSMFSDISSALTWFASSMLSYAAAVKSLSSLSGVFDLPRAFHKYFDIPLSFHETLASNPGLFSAWWSSASIMSLVVWLTGLGIMWIKRRSHDSPTLAKGSVEVMQDFTVTTPIKGRSVPLSEVTDPIFSQGLLGPGMAIVPDSGPVVSPVDGEVLVAFPTGHAYGLRSTSGIELLIHVGVDTVELDGKHFRPRVGVGDKVCRGQILVDVDWKAIKAAGYETVTPVVVTNAVVFDTIRKTSPAETVPSDVLFSVVPIKASSGSRL